MGIRISEMEEATTFGADDYVPIVTNGTNKKALGAKIKDFIAGFFVNKSGDTMSGNLTVEKSNGEYRLKNPNVTINTTANNGVTSYQTEGFMIRDSVNNDIARFLSVQETTGDVVAQIASFNKKTNGTATNNYINVTIKKDGTSSYTVSDPTAFRRAIGLYDTVVPFKVNSSNSKTFTFNNYYRSMILLGFAQGIGSVILGIITNSNSSISVRNLMTNSDFSNAALTFTYSGNALTIGSTYSSDSVFTAILANVI